MSDVVGSDLIDGFAPWDGRRVPVTLLGGYLGSGKTTVINELLARTEQPIAVMVNDVGEVNIDASLIARHNGDTIELTDGCVCCSLNHGLAEAFGMLRHRSNPPDQVVLELSGVADPRPVLPWANSAGFRLDGVIVLIDADQFIDRLNDPSVGPTVEAQLLAADLFLLTKTDLVDDRARSEVLETIASLHPDVPLLPTDTPLSTASFLNVGTRHQGGAAAVPDPSLFDPHVATTVTIPDPIDLDALEQLLDGLDRRVMRAKGIARDPGGVRHLVQVVGRRRLITPLPTAEDEPATDLVVISARE